MTAIADRAWGHLEYLANGDDPESDTLLEAWVRGLLTPADRLSLIAHGDADRKPIDVITRGSAAELWSLPIVAAFHGGTVPRPRPSESDADYLARARREIVTPRGMRRGFKQALIDLATPFVNGTIRVLEFVDDDAFLVTLLVNPGSVADEAGLLEAVNDPDVVIAGMEIDLLESDAGTIGDLEAGYTTVGDVETAFPTIGDMENWEP